MSCAAILSGSPCAWRTIARKARSVCAVCSIGAVASVVVGAAALRAEVTEAGLPSQVERNVLGVEITAPAGVRPSALEEVTRIVQIEVGHNKYAQQHFRESRVAIVIVRAHVAMTALSEFAHLAGKKTFDGRDWSAVRGSGGWRCTSSRTCSSPRA